jgi:nicotinate-nucleotide adenylyltransferase
MTERIGIFGGTFDPPHLGHLILACEAHYQLALTRLLWVLTPVPPHKRDQQIASTDHRLNMVQLALAGNPAFEISRVELDRPGPHYSLDTVRLLGEQFPGAELIYLMGGDSLSDLPQWHRPADLLRAVDALGVMRRPGDRIDLPKLEEVLPGLTGKVRFVEAPLLEIAARQLRQRIAEGRPCRYYLPPAVYDYIQQNELYR